VAFETNCRSIPVPFALLLKRTARSLVPDAASDKRAAAGPADALVAPHPSSFLFRKHYCAAHLFPKPAAPEQWFRFPR
jgi:hypothetical protein